MDKELQGNEDWKQDRSGKVTASMFKVARSKLKNGNYSAAAIRYAQEIARERDTGIPAPSIEPNEFMAHGTRMEPVARRIYEIEHDCDVVEVGFIPSQCGRFGASPDGLVGDDAGIEIKCPSSQQKIAKVFAGDFSEYLDQILGCLWITGRERWDLIVYDARREDKDLRVFPIYRDQEAIDALVADLEQFNNFVEGLRG